MKKIALSLAAISMASAPVVAQSLPASAPIEGEQLGEEGGSGTALALLAGIVAIVVIAIATDDDDGVSP